MSRINRELLAEGVGISMYLETEITSVDCQNKFRCIDISLVVVNNTQQQCHFEGVSSISAIGYSSTFSDVFTAPVGESKMFTCTAEEVYGSDYGEVMPVSVEIGHVCNEAGFSETVTVARDFAIGRLITGIDLTKFPMDYFLGEKAYYRVDDFDDGYDVYVIFSVNGKVVETLEMDQGDWSIVTPMSLANYFPDRKYLIGAVDIYAYCNGQRLYYGEWREAVYNLREHDGIPDVKLSVTTESENLAVSTFGKAVRNKSSVILDARDTVTKYGAWVAERYIVVNGQRYDTDLLDTDIITEAGVYNCTFTAVDSRGFKNSASASFEVLDYANPTALISATRCNENGSVEKTGSHALISARCNDVFRYDGANESAIYYTLSKKSGEVLIEERMFPRTDAPCILDFGLEMDESYVLRFICRDDFDGSTVYTFELDCARVEMNISKNKVAIGKYAVTENLFDCAWPARINGDITFTDADENEVSLRGALLSGSGAVRFKKIAVATAQELTPLLVQENEGLCIVLAAVGSTQKRVYLLYKLGDESWTVKLFSE